MIAWQAVDKTPTRLTLTRAEKIERVRESTPLQKSNLAHTAPILTTVSHRLPIPHHSHHIHLAQLAPLQSQITRKEGQAKQHQSFIDRSYR